MVNYLCAEVCPREDKVEVDRVGGVEYERLGASLGARPEELPGGGLLVGGEVVEELGDLVVVLLLEEEPRPRHAVVVARRTLRPQHAAEET